MRGAGLWFVGTVVLLAGCGAPVPPVAEAGPPLRARVGQSVTLDGRCSFDPDRGAAPLPSEWPCDPATGAIVAYAWRIVGAPPGRREAVGRLLHAAGPEPVATWLPGTGDGGQWILELEVTDQAGRHATDTVTVTVVE